MKKDQAPGPTVAARLKEFLRQELHAAKKTLETSPVKKGESSVPEARKAIKKLRAGVRLARKMFSEAKLRRLKSSLRAAAHLLGPLRDHEVLKVTVSSLSRAHEPVPEEKPDPPSRPPRLKAGEALRKAAVTLKNLSWTGIEPGAWKAGLKRLYRRGSDAMKEAGSNRGDDDLHKWRRRVKDFLYALELLKKEEIPGGASMLKRTRHLAQLLGEDHDLAFFEQRYSSSAGRKKLKIQFGRAKKRRRGLQKKAFRLGRWVFRRSPGALVSELG
jgi:CHAD domain-containing protein